MKIQVIQENFDWRIKIKNLSKADLNKVVRKLKKRGLKTIKKEILEDTGSKVISEDLKGKNEEFLYHYGMNDRFLAGSWISNKINGKEFAKLISSD